MSHVTCNVSHVTYFHDKVVKGLLLMGPTILKDSVELSYLLVMNCHVMLL